MSWHPDIGKGERYRYIPGHELPFGVTGNLFYSTLSRQHQLLSKIESGYIATCTRFATLEEHARRICNQFRLNDQDHPAVRSVLIQACERGLLVAEGDLSQNMPEKFNEPSGRIDTIAIPTRNRCELLSRTINSFAANNSEFGRATSFFACDATDDPQLAGECRERLRGLGHRLQVPIEYAGMEEKRSYAAALAKRAGLENEIVEFALFGLGECNCSIGANRNAILLHSLGSLVLNVDDDVLCDLMLPPEASRDDLWLESEAADITDSWFYPHLDDLRNAVTPLHESVLDAHERLLGKTVGVLAARTAERGEIHWDTACRHVLHSLQSGNGPVTATYNGIAGNPGMHNRGSLLFAGRRTHDRLVASEEQYRLALMGGEMVRAVPHLVLSHGGPWTGGSFALDNRDLLPPFLPVQRGEDGLFGFLLSNCFSECYLAHLPETVLHAPAYSISTGDPADTFSQLQLSEIFIGLVLAAPRSPSLNSRSERMVQLGRYLVDAGSASDQEFEEFLKPVLWSRAGRMAMWLDRLLLEYRGEPAFWAEDIQRGLQALKCRINAGDYTIPGDLLSGRTALDARMLTKRLCLQYGHLLACWPAMVAAARELRQQEAGLGSKLMN